MVCGLGLPEPALRGEGVEELRGGRAALRLQEVRRPHLQRAGGDRPPRRLPRLPGRIIYSGLFPLLPAGGGGGTLKRNICDIFIIEFPL